MDETRNKRHELISAIEAERGSKVLTYMLSPQGASVADDVVPPLFHQLMTMGRQTKIDLMISARGGSPEAVWRVLSLLREFCDHLSVIVPGQLFSASAFIALGADEIIMSPISELGPMHIQTVRSEPDDEASRFINPFDIMEYMRFASFWDVDTTTAFDRIEIDPMMLGSAMRAHNLAVEVCEKAVALSGKKYEEDEAMNIVSEFVTGSYSSNLPFTRRGCKELGLPVIDASPSLESKIGNLNNLYLKQVSTRVPIDSGSQEQAHTVTPAILESLRLTLVHRRRIELIPGGGVKETPGWGGWMDDTIQEAM